MEAEADRDKLSRSARHAKERLAEMEKDRKDLADEYVVLKTNYLALVRESEKEVILLALIRESEKEVIVLALIRETEKEVVFSSLFVTLY